MNNISPFRSLRAELNQLSIGISRQSVRPVSSRRKRIQDEKIPPNFEPGHGEKIWIFNNFVDGLTVYSHSPILKMNKALRQIPFNGKKLKPAKLRKDYWRPMAMIQFPEGMGHVGRSVFHLMREFKALHDYQWPDSTFHDKETNRVLTKHERGVRLNEQKANSIADMAAVLGGVGKGNKMWTPVIEEVSGAPADANEGSTTKDETTPSLSLVPATVFWANDLDKSYAKAWPANISHAVFEESVVVPAETQAEVDESEGQQKSWWQNIMPKKQAQTA